MNTRSTETQLLTAALTFLLIAAGVAAQVQPTGPGSADELRAQAASYLDLPAESLSDPVVQQVHLAALGVTLTVVKATDLVTGDVVGGTFDEAGRSVDLSGFRALEVQARQINPQAKIHPSLAERLAQAQGVGQFPVVAWLHYDTDILDLIRRRALEGIDDTDAKAREAAEARLTEQVIARNAEVVQPFARVIESAGIPVRYASTTAPVVFVTADAVQIAMLAELPEVDTLYLEQVDGILLNVDANETHRTYRVHNFGVKGRGIKVAVLENSGVDDACPYLKVQDWFVDPPNENPQDHVHATSGCIASQLPSRLGAAPDVLLYSANASSFSYSNIVAAADWIATQNIDVTSMSFGWINGGYLHFSDRYFDYQTRTFADSYVAGSGNHISGYADRIFSPAAAWNVVAAGAIENQDTGDWLDDTMAPWSCWINLLNGGCEKPNVVAVGVVDTLGDGNINFSPIGPCPTATQPAPWLIDHWCGTSFSAPFVAGNLANSMVADPTLQSYPEAAMAMMMATAWHNIEGASSLSGYDGAGGINAVAAYRAAAASKVQVGSYSSSSFNNNGYYTRDIWLQGGDMARVCLAWSANANSSYTTTVLDADLDIAILAGQGTTTGSPLGSSASFSNNFEIVEFMPPSTGWYTVRVDDYRFDGTSEPYGICWTQRNIDGVSARFRENTAEADPKCGPTIGSNGYYLDWDARNSPGNGYITFPSGTITTGLKFADHIFCPLDYDIVTTLWLDHFTSGLWFWVNPVGTLDSFGNDYNHGLNLPDYPLLVGDTIYHVGITADVLAPNGLQETTEVFPTKFWPDPVDLTESDDGSVLQSLPFGFKFYGVTHTECYVNMNGSVTFGAGSSDATESVSDLLANEPRICGMWSDLGPHQAGTQSGNRVQTRQIYQLEQELIVEFINIPVSTSSDPLVTGNGSNTFRIHLHQNDSITLEYRDCTLDDCIVGISPGGGISTATEQDLSSYGLGTSGTNQALFQDCNSGTDPLDLAHPTFWCNKLRFVPTSSAATDYRLEVDTE